MAALDFPSSPTNGQVFGNWVYNDTKQAWQSTPLTPAKTVNSPTAPSSPAAGDQWFNTNNGSLYIYYTDANTSQWVESRAPITADGYISPNYVINGAFDIWQRGTSGIASASGVNSYSADRWESYRDGYAAGLTTYRLGSPGFGLNGFQYGARIQRNSGNTGLGSITFGQCMETANSLLLVSKTMTMSFYARVGANYSGGSSFIAAIRTGTLTDSNHQAGGLMTSAATLTPTLTTSWQRFTLTGIISASATQVGTHFNWTPSGTAGANDYVDIAGVQLEEGSIATPFRRNANSIAGEFATCQRYFIRLGGSNQSPENVAVGGASSSTSAYVMANHKVTMRIEPTPSIWGTLSDLKIIQPTGAQLPVTSVSNAVGGKNGHLLAVVVSSGLTAGQYTTMFTTTANVAVDFNAEL